MIEEYHDFDLADGTRLAYLDAGTGDVVLLLAGWSQSVAQYRHQFDDFAREHRVIALDWRGHGRSSKPTGGYRVGRMAADLREFLTGMGLAEVSIVAHSVGASLLWGYLEAYGTSGISRLVFVDEATAVAAKPDWNDTTRRDRGCSIATLEDLRAFYERVLASETVSETVEIVRGLFSETFPEEQLRWVAAENLLLPRRAAADLLWETALIDWADLFPRILVPTLVIGAEQSLFPAESQRWIAEQLPNGRVEIFEAAEGGSHFMFMENPSRFNGDVLQFLRSA